MQTGCDSTEQQDEDVAESAVNSGLNHSTHSSQFSDQPNGLSTRLDRCYQIGNDLIPKSEN